jgi:hypothetical protein
MHLLFLSTNINEENGEDISHFLNPGIYRKYLNRQLISNKCVETTYFNMNLMIFGSLDIVILFYKYFLNIDRFHLE